MNHTLALIAALGLMTSPALAEGTTKAEIKTPVAATTAVTTTGTKLVTPVAAELQDGTKVSIKGDAVFVVGADGKETAAPDGTHTLKDGTSVTTKGGLLVK